jgi:transposase-like protein
MKCPFSFDRIKKLTKPSMSTHTFSKEEVLKLKSNQWVQNCSLKSITYTKEFKTYALELAMQGVRTKEIWRRAGLDIFKHEHPKDCLKRWRKVTRLKGYEGLTERRGSNAKGRRKTKEVTDEDKIRRLELEVKYLKAENDFLAKLRAKRAE